MIRFYCDGVGESIKDREPHPRRWVAQYMRAGHTGAEFAADGGLRAHQPPGIPVLSHAMPTGWSADTWVHLTPPDTAAQRRRERLAQEVPGSQRDRLRALALATRPNPRAEDPTVSEATTVEDYLTERRATFNNRCGRCGFSVPRRGENMAPLLDGFETLAEATGVADFTLAQLRDVARRWDATHRAR